MKKITLADLMYLSVGERILLAEDLWDSVAEVPEAVPLTEDQREELDRRLEAYHQNPEAGSPWEDVKARLQRS